MTTPILSVEGLAIEIGGQELVSDVDFTVGRGGSIGIVGETGSGKTLTCRAVAGLLGWIGGTIKRGRIVYEGQELGAGQDGRWRALRGSRVAMVPQRSLGGLDPIMRVGGQLTETIVLFHPKDEAGDRALDLLERLELPDPRSVLRRYPHELSGGMRQRVMIALALAGEPDLLVADEPTTALDVTVQREILELLQQLQRDRGLTMVLVSHDLGLVEVACEDVVVMYAGMSVETGATRDVLRRPEHPYTKALLDARPLTRDPVPIPGSTPGPSEWPDGCRFAPRCPYCEQRCTIRKPDLVAARPGHGTACVRHDDLVLS